MPTLFIFVAICLIVNFSSTSLSVFAMNDFECVVKIKQSSCRVCTVSVGNNAMKFCMYQQLRKSATVNSEHFVGRCRRNFRQDLYRARN